MSQIFTVVPKLKEITATSVALALCNHFGTPKPIEWNVSNIGKSFSVIEFETNKVTEFTEEILLPKHLKKLIETYSMKILTEMAIWKVHHQEKIKSLRTSDLFLHLNDIIWYHNCTINYKETARSLQNSKCMNKIEKFHLLCLYCLKNEIELGRKLFGIKFFDEVGFQCYPLLYYWDRYFTNRLQDLPVSRGLSIDELMFRHDKVNNWPAKEYFFDRMNVDEQIQNTIWIIDHRKIEYQKLIIAKLNQSQRRTIYMNRSLQILKNFLSSEYSHEILPAWLEAADLISGVDFATLLRGLFAHKIEYHIIAEIWKSASDTLKIYVLNTEAENALNHLCYLWIRSSKHDMINLLLNTSKKIIKKFRKTHIFRNYCEHLLLKNELLMLNKVLNLCFKSDEEMVPIKRNLVQSKSFIKFCESLVLANDFLTLKQLFRLFSEATDLDPIKKLIVSKKMFEDHCKNLVKEGKIPVLHELLNMFCSSRIEEFKKSIREFFDSVSIECHRKLIIEEKLPTSARFLDFFRFGVEQSVRLKYFINYCEKMKEHDELSELETLLESLFPHAEELVAFMRAFSRENVFRDHCRKLMIGGQLSTLDELLNLIFPNVEESAKFKQDLSTKTFLGFLREAAK